MGGLSFLDAREHGSKAGSGFLHMSQESLFRRNRLKHLVSGASGSTDSLGRYVQNISQCECKLCLTIHSSEASYSSHIKGKRHARNLARVSTKNLNNIKSTSDLPNSRSDFLNKNNCTPDILVRNLKTPRSKLEGIFFQVYYCGCRGKKEPILYIISGTPNTPIIAREGENVVDHQIKTFILFYLFRVMIRLSLR